MEAFKGKFKRTSANNCEEFLKTLGVSWLIRKAAKVSTPVTEISEAGGEWTIRTSTTLKTVELKFKLGEEFDDVTADGRDVRVKVVFEEGKIITVQKAKHENEKSTRSVGEMIGTEELIYTLSVDGIEDIVCVQKFKRIN